MVECDSKEKIIDIELTDVMIGGKDKNMHLYYQLIDSIKRAKQIDIIVSFLMESGVKMLIKELEKALERGVKIRLLTGNYLGITQPSALYLIKNKLGDKVDVRFYHDKNRSFHPKAYIFHYLNDSEIYIGSSNISRSALTSGIEWNYRLKSTMDQKNYDKFYTVFEDLFYNHSIIIDDEQLKEYARTWKAPKIQRELENIEKQDNTLIYEPRGAQIEAICALESTRNEGAKRALVQAATGVGKTYLAAFDSQSFKRVLFVAHRNEILQQAAKSFSNVRKNDDYGFFDGKIKTTDKSVIFASVSSLGRKEYLNNQYFSPTYFDYIVIDEFHHATTSQYKNIVEYFKPKFLLGLTATPERLDGKNIYEICDYNVPYEISLKEAINKGMLVPFRYYGIFDDIDYRKLDLVAGKYIESQLNEQYIGNQTRNDLIYKNYCKYGSKQALGFCCSRAHAREMAKEFSSRGVPSLAVYSNSNGEYTEDRKIALEKLQRGDIRIIFSVDIFNEGVDIPSIDMVMFLRPTQSPIVFLQQLGRGLRKYQEKTHLKVLDFIGNYEKAGRVRYLLAGNTNLERENYHLATQLGFPEECIIDFDLKLIDLFQEMDKKSLKIKDQIHLEYTRIKQLLQRVPTRLELFTYMDDDVYQLAITHKKENPFKNYIEYLHNQGDLQDEILYTSISKEFLSLLENTNMSKVYKMPVLMAFYNHGKMRMSLTQEDLLISWKEFFSTGTNWKDLETDITYDMYLSISDQQHSKKIVQMPVHFLQESGKGFFIKQEGSVIALREELKDIITNESFLSHMEDIIEYRTNDYYQRRYRQKKVH